MLLVQSLKDYLKGLEDLEIRRIDKACTAIDRLSIIWKSDVSGKIKPEFFQAEAMSVL